MYFVNCMHVVNLVRVYTVFPFLVFKFANEKRIPFSFSNFANQKQKANSFFVYRFQICERKTKNEFLFCLSFSKLK